MDSNHLAGSNDTGTTAWQGGWFPVWSSEQPQRALVWFYGRHWWWWEFYLQHRTSTCSALPQNGKVRVTTQWSACCWWGPCVSLCNSPFRTMAYIRCLLLYSWCAGECVCYGVKRCVLLTESDLISKLDGSESLKMPIAWSCLDVI